MNIDHRYQIDIEKKLQRMRTFTRPRAIEIASQLIPQGQAEQLFDQWLRGGFIRLHEITPPAHQPNLFDNDDAASVEYLQKPEAQTYKATFGQARKRQAADADLVTPLSALEAILIRAENARNGSIGDSGRDGQSLFRKQLVMLHKRCRSRGVKSKPCFKPLTSSLLPTAAHLRRLTVWCCAPIIICFLIDCCWA